MPPVHDAATDLLAAFLDLGMVQATFDGEAALSFTEIASAVPWADPAERKAIRDMSRSYIEGHSIGADPFGMPPWS